MLALQGNTAPYMLYAYVRVQGISRKGNIDFDQIASDLPIALEDGSELVLLKHILQMADVIAQVSEDLMPNRLVSVSV